MCFVGAYKQITMHLIVKCAVLLCILIISGVYGADTHYLQQGESYNFNPYYSNKLQTYCYLGKPKYIIYLWQSVTLQIESKTDNYLWYDGSSPEEVKNVYQARKSSWSVYYNLFSWKQNYFKLNPFNQSCVGIESTDLYIVKLNVIRVDYWKVLRLVLGILLFLSADKLSKNTLFYYICGITLGITASFLVVVYLLSKLFPKRPVMYGIAACGWTVGIYILQTLWDNMRVILASYQIYVIYYICVTGFVSFVVCYRLGPVTNDRTRNLIRWSLQGAGLALVFSSSHFQEAAMGQIVLLLILYNLPQSWIAKSQTYWKRKFPPKTKLLSNDEYYQQGVRETSKALDELRKYCSSPECNQWKTALKLKDVKSPNNSFSMWTPPKNQRFASFIEGSSHLSDEEILEYETSIHNTDLTDDEELTDEEI